MEINSFTEIYNFCVARSSVSDAKLNSYLKFRLLKGRTPTLYIDMTHSEEEYPGFPGYKNNEMDIGLCLVNPIEILHMNYISGAGIEFIINRHGDKYNLYIFENLIIWKDGVFMVHNNDSLISWISNIIRNN